MKIPTLPSPLSLITTISLFLVVTHGTENGEYTLCSKPYKCGSDMYRRNITYPFWGRNHSSFCGAQGFGVTCQEIKNNMNLIFDMGMGSQPFRVLDVNPSAHTMTMARADLWEDLCSMNLHNTMLDASLFEYSQGRNENLTLFYSCDMDNFDYTIEDRDRFYCGEDGTDFFVNETQLALVGDQARCRNNIKVPVLRKHLDAFKEGEFEDLIALVNAGFEVVYRPESTEEFCRECESSSEICESSTRNRFTCFCEDGDFAYSCPIQGLLLFFLV